MTRMLISLNAFFILCSSTFLFAEDAIPEKNVQNSAVERELIHLINETRKEWNVRPLKANRELNEAAKTLSEAILETGSFSHSAGGTRLSSRVKDAGYRWTYVSENIAWRTGDEESTDDEIAKGFRHQWVHSSGHYQNLINGNADECGVAIVKSEASDRIYAVMVYGAADEEES